MAARAFGPPRLARTRSSEDRRGGPVGPASTAADRDQGGLHSEALGIAFRACEQPDQGAAGLDVGELADGLDGLPPNVAVVVARRLEQRRNGRAGPPLPQRDDRLDANGPGRAGQLLHQRRLHAVGPQADEAGAGDPPIGAGRIGGQLGQQRHCRGVAEPAQGRQRRTADRGVLAGRLANDRRQGRRDPALGQDLDDRRPDARGNLRQLCGERLHEPFIAGDSHGLHGRALHRRVLARQRRHHDAGRPVPLAGDQPREGGHANVLRLAGGGEALVDGPRLVDPAGGEQALGAAQQRVGEGSLEGGGQLPARGRERLDRRGAADLAQRVDGRPGGDGVRAGQ
jgi:hypothetical protein